MSLVQAPADAEYAGMPSAAIATGRADFVLPAAEIPAKLIELWKNAQAIELPGAKQIGLRAREPQEEAAARAEAALDEIIAILASRTGNDFRHYKRGTVLRRLERRMQVTRQQNIAAYREYLESHPQETVHLLQDMLISVTSFFRDADAFEGLHRELAAWVFPQLAEGRGIRPRHRRDRCAPQDPAHEPGGLALPSPCGGCSLPGPAGGPAARAGFRT